MIMVTLREFQWRDLDNLVLHANNPKVAMYLRDFFPSPYTEESARWWLEVGCRQENAINFAVAVDDELVGGIGARFFTDEHKHSAEIGYWLGEAQWGKGITAQAVALLEKKLFALPNIYRLTAPVAHANVGSRRVLEKCGFQCEGILKRAISIRSGTYDEHIYAKLK